MSHTDPEMTKRKTYYEVAYKIDYHSNKVKRFEGTTAHAEAKIYAMRIALNGEDEDGMRIHLQETIVKEVEEYERTVTSYTKSSVLKQLEEIRKAPSREIETPPNLEPDPDPDPDLPQAAEKKDLEDEIPF